MRKRLDLFHVALFHVTLAVAWPATAQIATVPVGSLTQTSAKDTAIALAVSLYGYTPNLPTPRLLANQTVKLAPVSLLQPEVRAEFPGYKDAGLTLMQLVVKSTIEGPTFHSTTETVAPKEPLSINVPAGKKLWVVYSAPTGQQGQLRFYVGTPPPGSTTTPSTGSAAASGTRITQVGQSFVDSAGNKWSLGPPDPARGPAPVILRNDGVKDRVFGVAFELVWQNGLVHARNAGGWWSIGPLETNTSAWDRMTSGPSAPPASSPTAPTTPSTGSAAASGTRITQVGQSFVDSAGNKWSLGPPDPARGPAPVILRNDGVKDRVFGVAFELVWQNGLIHARNAGGWWSIGPREANTSAWDHLTSGPSAPAGSGPDVGTPPPAPTTSSTNGASTPWGAPATVKAMTAPIVRVKDFGAQGDGVTDDTAAINRAIASMTTGGTLVFEVGKKYLTRKRVVVNKPNVKLWGYGAKLYAVTTEAEIAAVAVQQGVLLDAPGTEILGFDISSNLKKRLSGVNGGPGKHLILISNNNTKVIDNRLTDGHGIYVWRDRSLPPVQNFQIINNYVYRVWSDGIHVTGQGTNNGLISRNIVRENGDDMIAVVNYRSGDPTIHNIEISDNDVARNYSGRGITVLGGKDIKVLRNKIDLVYTGAGIFLFGDGLHWKTADVKRVLVEGNTITRIMTDMPAYNPTASWNLKTYGAEVPRLSKGGIDLIANSTDRLVADNIIRNNKIEKVRGDGLHMRGNVCGTVHSGNETSNLNGAPVNAAVTCTRG